MRRLTNTKATRCLPCRMRALCASIRLSGNMIISSSTGDKVSLGDLFVDKSSKERAKMDMKTKMHRDGAFKDVERAAIAQEEGVRPIPKGSDAACTSGGECTHHADRLATSSSSTAKDGEEGLETPSLPTAASSVDDEQPFASDADAAHADMLRFLSQNTMLSIQRSAERDGSLPTGQSPSVYNSASSSLTAIERLPPGHRGVQALLDYNKQWAAEVCRFNPRYFSELAKQQKPEYLWIGCSDSRVPANEIVGLHPGDVFVHRNIGNIFSLSDLNCLSALQFAVDCLNVQHVIIAGHYKCGGVTAAMKGIQLGLTDHWIMQVTDIKNKHWDRVLAEIPEEEHLNVLCELNVLEQLSHVVNCRIVQRRWKSQHDEDRYHRRDTQHIFVRPQYAIDHFGVNHNVLESTSQQQDAHHDPQQEELEAHAWVYSLDDGILRPLLSLTRFSHVKKDLADATEAVFARYAQLNGSASKR